MTKKSRQKFKYLENGKSFRGEIKSTFHRFKGLWVPKNCLRPASAPLRKRLNEIGICKVPNKEIISVAEFTLKNNCFEFDENICRQISRAAIGTKFAPPQRFYFHGWNGGQISYHNNCSHSSGLDILTTYFLSELIVKKNLNYFLKILTSFM